MKSASVALQAFLATSQQLYKADLYRIVLADGAVLLWTDFDIDVTVNGATYLSSGPPLKRSRIQQTIGLEVATLTIELLASPLNQIPKVSGVGTYPVLQALAADRFADFPPVSEFAQRHWLIVVSRSHAPPARKTRPR